MSESSIESSRADLLHSEVMILKELDMVVSVATANVLLTDPIHIEVQVMVMETPNTPGSGYSNVICRLMTVDRHRTDQHKSHRHQAFDALCLNLSLSSSKESASLRGRAGKVAG